MIYHVKGVKRVSENGRLVTRERMYAPCAYYEATEYSDTEEGLDKDSGLPYGRGAKIELLSGGKIIDVIRIPEDADSVYIMNEEGHNLDSYPKKSAKKEFRA